MHASSRRDYAIRLLQSEAPATEPSPPDAAPERRSHLATALLRGTPAPRSRDVPDFQRDRLATALLGDER
jgi:hypothetical protein